MLYHLKAKDIREKLIILKEIFVNIAKFITEESVENAIDKKQYYYMLPFIEESGERFYQMTVCFNV